MLSIFKKCEKPLTIERRRCLNNIEYNVAHRYILLNCNEVKPYVKYVYIKNKHIFIAYVLNFKIGFPLRNMYESWLRECNSYIQTYEVDKKLKIKYLAQFEDFMSTFNVLITITNIVNIM